MDTYSKMSILIFIDFEPQIIDHPNLVTKANDF